MRTSTIDGVFGIIAFSRVEEPEVVESDLATVGPAPLSYVALELNSVGDMFRELELGESGVALLLTERGMVAASSDESYVRHSTFERGLAHTTDAAGHDTHELLRLIHPLLLA